MINLRLTHNLLKMIITPPSLIYSFSAVKKLPETDLGQAFSQFFNDKKQIASSGRSWRAQQLRLKSNEDLHKLWYVCVKQKNSLLADQVLEKKIFDERGRFDGRLEKIKKTMSRILCVIQQRQIIRRKYRQKLQNQYIQSKRKELEQKVVEQPESMPEITTQILRAKYFELRKGIDNTKYLEKIFQRNKEWQDRRDRMQKRMSQNDLKEFSSFWNYEVSIGERPLQQEVLRAHVKNWKSLNLKQRKIIMGFLNARRANDAKSSFLKELKILGQKIAHDQVKNRIENVQ